MKREDGELRLREFRDRFVFYVMSVDRGLGALLKRLPPQVVGVWGKLGLGWRVEPSSIVEG